MIINNNINKEIDKVRNKNYKKRNLFKLIKNK